MQKLLNHNEQQRLHEGMRGNAERFSDAEAAKIVTAIALPLLVMLGLLVAGMVLYGNGTGPHSALGGDLLLGAISIPTVCFFGAIIWGIKFVNSPEEDAHPQPDQTIQDLISLVPSSD